MNKYLVIFLILFISLLSATYYFNNKKQSENLEIERQELIEDFKDIPEITLNTKHQFKNGEHIFVPNIETPSPCHKISYEIRRENENTYVDLKISDPDPEVICAQVISQREVKIAIAGQKEDNIIFTLNGEVVNLNVYEISPEKNIDEVEIFDKG